MLTALALFAQLTILPAPREEVVFANPDSIHTPRSGRAARLLAQGAAGMGLGLVFGVVAQQSNVGSLVPCAGGVLPTCPSAGSTGLQTGFGLGAGGGVYGVGQALDGDGSIAGMGMGMGLGATTALMVSMFLPELGDAAALTLPLAGALAGYELGGSDASNSFSLRPSFSVWKGQISVGMKGEF
jgi:hypothetical protein